MKLQFRASVEGRAIGERVQIDVAAGGDQRFCGGVEEEPQPADDEVQGAALGEVARPGQGADEQGGQGGHGHRADKAVAGEEGTGESPGLSIVDGHSNSVKILFNTTLCHCVKHTNKLPSVFSLTQVAGDGYISTHNVFYKALLCM